MTRECYKIFGILLRNGQLVTPILNTDHDTIVCIEDYCLPLSESESLANSVSPLGIELFMKMMFPPSSLHTDTWPVPTEAFMTVNNLLHLQLKICWNKFIISSYK